MDERIDLSYLTLAVEELYGLLGLTEPVDPGPLVSLARQQRAGACIAEMARIARLSASFTIEYVSAEYTPGGPHFQSRALTERQGSSGQASIAAQVVLPATLPFWGTKELAQTVIRLIVSDDYFRQPESFVAIAAHELSHVVLQCLGHSQCRNEVYVDIASLMLGFLTAVRMGRVSICRSVDRDTIFTSTVKYGYLTDAQFEHVTGALDERLAAGHATRDELRTAITRARGAMAEADALVGQFRTLIDSLDANVDRVVPSEYGARVAALHALDYERELERRGQALWQLVSGIDEALIRGARYGRGDIERTQAATSIVLDRLAALEAESTIIREDVRLLRDCLRTKPKRRTWPFRSKRLLR